MHLEAGECSKSKITVPTKQGFRGKQRALRGSGIQGEPQKMAQRVKCHGPWCRIMSPCRGKRLGERWRPLLL